MKTKQEKLAQFRDAIRSWTHLKGDEKSLQECYTSDRKGLRGVLKLYKEGKLQEAYKAAWRLDTIVRDQIPQAVWDDFLQSLP